MQAIDFGRSFVTWRIDSLKKPPATASHEPPYALNNARVPIECRCKITERRSGRAYEFVLGANCKTERVGVERDLWTQPNADFVPVASRDWFLAIKSFDRVGVRVPLYPPSLGMQPERQLVRVAKAFETLRIDIAMVEGRTLVKNKEIVRAVLDNRPIVATTSLESERYTALLEYPIKTINANERDGVFQPDTGPIAFPDLALEPDELIRGFELAFVAYNTADWAEFLLRCPVTIADGVAVYHYARSVALPARNQLVAVGM